MPSRGWANGCNERPAASASGAFRASVVAEQPQGVEQVVAAGGRKNDDPPQVSLVGLAQRDGQVSGEGGHEAGAVDYYFVYRDAVDSEGLGNDVAMLLADEEEERLAG